MCDTAESRRGGWLSIEHLPRLSSQGLGMPGPMRCLRLLPSLGTPGIPRSHTVKGETQLLEALLGPPWTLAPWPSRNTHTINKHINVKVYFLNHMTDTRVSRSVFSKVHSSQMPTVETTQGSISTMVHSAAEFYSVIKRIKNQASCRLPIIPPSRCGD